MLLLRLCPLIPFNGLNYVLGITGVSWEDFMWALLIGSFPSMLLTVVMGATAEAISQRHNDPDDYRQELAHIILFCSGIAFAAIAVVYTWKKAKKELQKVRRI